MTAAVRGMIRQLEAATDPPSDAACTAAFAANRDAEAFATLVARHGPMVYGACRRILGDAHAAEDAFQAVFLVLAQKADSVRPPGAVGGWLYGVAIRTANKAKVAAGRRRRREMIAAALAARECPPADSADHAEVASVLDQELAKLPQPLRAAIVLCDLHGKTRSEAAHELKCPEGTVAARLHRGRKKLADALTRRGLALPVAGLAAVLTPAAVPAAGSQAVLSFAAGAAASPIVAALAREVIRSMATITNSIAVAVLALVAGGVLAAGGLWPSAPEGQAQATAASFGQKAPAPTEAAGPKPDPAAARVPGYVQRVQFSPDGSQYLLVANGVTVHDSISRRILWTTQGEAARYLSDGKSIIVMGAKAVSQHNAMTGKETKTYPRPKTDWGWHLVAFSPDGKRWAAHFGASVRIYDTETGFEPVRLQKQFDQPGSAGYLATVSGTDLFFLPDGKKLFANGVLVDQSIMGAAEWNVETGKRLNTFSGLGRLAPYSAAYTPDGSALAIGYQDRVDCWPTIGSIRKLPMPGRVTAIAFSPDGKLLAAGFRREIHNPADKDPAILGHKTELLVLDFASGKELRRFDGFEGGAATTELAVTTLSFSPLGHRLLAGTGVFPMETWPDGGPKRKSGEVKIFQVTSDDKGEKQVGTNWTEAGKVEGINDYVDSIAFSPNGKTFAVGSLGERANLVQVLESSSLKQVWRNGIPPRGFAAVAYSPDGKLLAATLVQAINFYDVESGKPFPLTKPFPGGKAVAWSPDGKWVAYSDGRRMGFRALDANAGEASETAQVPESESYPGAVAWSPDSLYLIYPFPTPGRASFIGMVGVTENTKPMNLSGHKSQVTAVAWSKDGRFIASGDEDGKVILWDGKTFKELRRVDLGGRSGKSTIYALAFSPDSRTLAAALEFDEGKNVNRVVILDPNTGERTQNDLQHFLSPPMTVAFSPDGKMLLVGCGSRIANQRNLPAEQRKGGVYIFTQPDQSKTPVGTAPAPPAAAAPTWREKAAFKDATGSVVSVAIEPNSGNGPNRQWDDTFAAGNTDGRSTIWKASLFPRSMLLSVRPEKNEECPTGVAFSPDGRLFASTFPGGAYVTTTSWAPVFIKKTGSGNEADILKGQANPLAVAFGASEKVNDTRLNRLAMTDGRSVIAAVWLDGGPPSYAKFGPMADAPKIEGQPPAGVAYSPDGKRLVFIPNYKVPQDDAVGKVMSRYWIAQVWGGGSGAPMAILKHGLSMVTAVTWSADGKYIATGDAAGEIALWDGKTYKEVRRIKLARAEEECTVNALAFTHDGKSLAVACSFEEGKNANRVVFVDPETGNRGEELHSFTSAPLSLAFSEDDQTLLVGCGCRLVNVKKPIPEDQRHEGYVRVFTKESAKR